MTLRDFIRSNRAELDAAIGRALGCPADEIPYRNDEERQLWILNDEGLYLWARSAGVRL